MLEASHCRSGIDGGGLDLGRGAGCDTVHRRVGAGEGVSGVVRAGLGGIRGGRGGRGRRGMRVGVGVLVLVLGGGRGDGGWLRWRG